jgi:hypothetical protein
MICLKNEYHLFKEGTIPLSTNKLHIFDPVEFQMRRGDIL